MTSLLQGPVISSFLLSVNEFRCWPLVPVPSCSTRASIHVNTRLTPLNLLGKLTAFVITNIEIV